MKLLELGCALRDDGSVSLWRLTLFRCKWFGVDLEMMQGESPEAELHDHAHSTALFVLVGDFVEETEDAYRRVRWFRFMRAERAHRVHSTGTARVWCLAFNGPDRRVAGYFTRSGWVCERDYRGARDAMHSVAAQLHGGPCDGKFVRILRGVPLILTRPEEATSGSHAYELRPGGAVGGTEHYDYDPDHFKRAGEHPLNQLPHR